MQLFDALSLIQNVLEACGTRLPWESMTPGQSQWLLSGWGGVTSGRKRGGSVVRRGCACAGPPRRAREARRAADTGSTTGPDARLAEATPRRDAPLPGGLTKRTELVAPDGVSHRAHTRDEEPSGHGGGDTDVRGEPESWLRAPLAHTAPGVFRVSSSLREPVGGVPSQRGAGTACRFLALAKCCSVCA